MDFFIKKIFDGVSDDLVHLQFQKYSRGTFKDKSIVIAKNSKGLYSISTTSEYASEFVRAVAEELGDAPVKVTGAVISTYLKSPTSNNKFLTIVILEVFNLQKSAFGVSSALVLGLPEVGAFAFTFNSVFGPVNESARKAFGNLSQSPNI